MSSSIFNTAERGPANGLRGSSEGRMPSSVTGVLSSGSSGLTGDLGEGMATQRFERYAVSRSSGFVKIVRGQMNDSKGGTYGRTDWSAVAANEKGVMRRYGECYMKVLQRWREELLDPRQRQSRGQRSSGRLRYGYLVVSRPWFAMRPAPSY